MPRGRKPKDDATAEAEAMAALHQRDLSNRAFVENAPVDQSAGLAARDAAPTAVGDEDHDYDELTQLDDKPAVEDQTGPDSEADDDSVCPGFANDDEDA